MITTFPITGVRAQTHVLIIINTKDRCVRLFIVLMHNTRVRSVAPSAAHARTRRCRRAVRGLRRSPITTSTASFTFLSVRLPARASVVSAVG